MAEVSEVVLRYAARGAQEAQRADQGVRRSVNRTAKMARKQTGAINRWMQRNRAALLGIAAAATGAMMAIIRASPTLSAQLAEVRLGFSLLAMQIGQDVAPATRGLAEKALELADAYSDLPDAIRKPISALVFFGGILVAAATAAAALESVIAGTLVGSALSSLAGGLATAGSAVASFVATAASWLGGVLLSVASSAFGILTTIISTVIGWIGTFVSAIASSTVAVFAIAAAIGAAIGTFVVWILKITGVLKWIGNLGAAVRNIVGGPIADFILALGTITGILPLLGALGGFIIGFLEGGLSEGIARATEVLNVFLDATVRTFNNIVSAAGDLIDGAINMIVGGLNNAVGAVTGAARNVANSITGTISDVINGINPLRWGRDLMDEFISGINERIGDVESLAEDVVDSVRGALGFDVPANDRMARRWGSDVIDEFSKGMKQNKSTLERAAPSPGQATGLGSMAENAARAASSGGGGGGSTVEIVFEDGAIRMQATGDVGTDIDSLIARIKDELGREFGGRSNL